MERLADVRRRFRHVLLVGAFDAEWPSRLGAKADRVSVVDPSPGLAARAGGVAASEAVLPFDPGKFDAVVAAGTLDTADDLPGALLEFRRVLVPDGLLIGVVPAAGSLPRLRAAMLAADESTGAAAARLHPGLDARTMGDLLTRAGFVLTVADVDRIDVGYASLSGLVGDLRSHAATNVLARRSRRPIGRSALRAARAAFAATGRDGRTYERFELLHFSGWTPGPDQPKPARPGSATTSLAGALRGEPRSEAEGRPANFVNGMLLCGRLDQKKGTAVMDKQRAIRMLVADQRGATAVEYGLIIALIFLAAVGAIGTFASTATGMWNDVAENIAAS